MTKTNLILKIIKGVIIVFTVLATSVILLFYLSGLFNENKYSQVFGYSLFEVSSNSMHPELEKGDLIVVKQLDAQEYKVGMIITYQPVVGNTPVTHKIVEINGDTITTQGIANNDKDQPFNVDRIIGKVVRVYKGYGNFENFVRNPIGLAIIFVGGLILFETANFLEIKFCKKDKK